MSTLTRNRLESRCAGIALGGMILGADRYIARSGVGGGALVDRFPKLQYPPAERVVSVFHFSH